jgi:benzoyl-CoA reductase/2-hydroxyglutaryl-CoA dehydratase subunit BcrC/BadD/HgdB
MPKSVDTRRRVRVLYTSPFIPPEFIAAHGLEPRLEFVGASLESSRLNVAGLCPYASAFACEAEERKDVGAVLFATSCDQMRRAAERFERDTEKPTFLFNLPSTKGETARRLYKSELARLGRFLLKLGGKRPAEIELAEAMRSADEQRNLLRAARPRMSGRKLAEALVALNLTGMFEISGRRGGIAKCERAGAHEIDVRAGAARKDSARADRPSKACAPNNGQTALALVGGPLAEEDFGFIDLVSSHGGRIVLNATEGGERTLAAPFDITLLESDPLEAFTKSYFDLIPDVFQRPQRLLFDWLAREIEARRVQAIIVRHYLWCDLWRAEVGRLAEEFDLPTLHLDVEGGESLEGRVETRVQAFMEILRTKVMRSDRR